MSRGEALVSAAPLVGRERELALLEERVAHISERGGPLVLRGEAGVGKSALLQAVRRRATDGGLVTLTTGGFQSETHVAFAALHRLLQPVLHGLGALPTPQRVAIEAAFGLDEAPAQDLFLIALAALSLLSEAATAAPLLLIVEDAEWLDLPSRDVLLFVARRLEEEPILMLLAVRYGSCERVEVADLPELEIGPLDSASSERVLGLHAPELSVGLRKRILAEAVGNPLALIEMSRAADVAFAPLSTAPLAMTERLVRAFAVRVSNLPPSARTLMLVVALDEGGDQQRMLEAASLLEGRIIAATDLAIVQSARAVIVDGDGLRFSHPLVRSAVYHGALAPERRAAHSALANVYRSDPDRAIWHEAASLAGPDDRVAGELEAMAERAVVRGATTVAVTALERAARLMIQDLERGRLLLRAAVLAHDLGEFDVTSALLQEAQQLSLAEHERTILRYLLELGRPSSWSGVAGIRPLVEIATQMHAVGETQRALDALVVAAVRCWWESPAQQIRDLVVGAAASLGVPSDTPALLATLAHADPVGQGREVIARISRLTPDQADPAAMHLVGLAAGAVWAFDLGVVFLTAAVDGLRAQGRLRELAEALASQAWAAVHLAREPLAVSAADEAIALGRETVQPRCVVVAQLAKATISAERGDLAAAEVLIREAESVVIPLGATPMLAMVQFVRGRGAVAHQQYVEGLDQLRRSLDAADPSYHPVIGAWGLSDLVEAAAHTGQAELADSYLAQLESLVAKTSGSLLIATAAYARPMVATDDDAEALYEKAVANALANWHCYRGRMLLWYGRWLRRQRRVADSRARLRAALDGFDALAFPALAQSARQELRASGEQTEQSPPEAWAKLTPQELQIAQLAAEGETNRAIGQRLYLSPRTVQSHMYRIFPKLGITARHQLRDVLSGLDVA